MGDRLKGKVALVTGASSGIGRATAIRFAEEGAKLVVNDIDETGGRETVKMIIENGGKAIFVKADVSKAEETKNMIDNAIKQWGRLDILHANAGGRFGLVATVIETSESVYDKVMDVNLKGFFLCAKYAIPQMKKQGGGVIVATASGQGLNPSGQKPIGVYCASKGGVILLAKALALDHGKDNIRVNSVCPVMIWGPPDTMAQREAIKRGLSREHFAKMLPLRRLGKPEEVANAVLFLASDEASYITGTTLLVDGGWMINGPERYQE